MPAVQCRMMSNQSENQNDHSPAAKVWRRRDFLKASSVSTLGLLLTRQATMAGPFTREDFDKLVPSDKKLSADWVKSLFERGAPEVLRGSDLKYVGMPVGGIGAGQLYLGGDGQLWHWDIFNRDENSGNNGPNYAKPLIPSTPFAQKFSLTVGGQTRALDREGFSDVSFRGEYPIGCVEYADAAMPLKVKLEAFSPFIPLNLADSSLPATILQFTIHNPSSAAVDATLTGELENAVCLKHRMHNGVLRRRTIRESGVTVLLHSAEAATTQRAARADVVFEDWSKETYEGWKVEGTAFGRGPISKKDIPVYQGDVGGDTARVVNSHATAPGDNTGAKDQAVGKLVSRDFVIERHAIKLWIGGGKGRKNSRFGVTLFVDGQPVRTLAGKSSNEMTIEQFDVRNYAGKTARLEILDDSKDGWGNVGVGKIIFTDSSEQEKPVTELPDHGTMALALLGTPAESASDDATAPFGEKLSGTLARKLNLSPGASATVTFVVTWHFPNLTLAKLGRVGRHYATRFDSALAVSQYVATNFDRLASATRLWRDTWYQSTLPYWFLDRTMLNTSILATSTSFRFANGRYYGWEGVGCCPGTCGHVYHYAHAAARLFPELERGLRETVDFGLALKPDGAIWFRGEMNNIPAVDSQAGTVLRALREHQMSADTSFLKKNWPKIKLATQWLITEDGDGDGLIVGHQHNTLDTDWFGPVAWLSGLYLAALAAAVEMATKIGDTSFADECSKILSTGQKKLVAELFDGNYFINKVDPKHLDKINSGTGCHIDQVFGQSWAFQVGLPRVLPKKETLTALESLWRYNFSPDVGPYRETNKPGRWYAMPGEAGLLMCSFPRKDWDYARAKGKGVDWAAGYFNECMNGFEYQVAGHMIWEGMVMEGLAITRAVHDRYHASRRNPWNEIECGDHYARSMASYGIYLAACGFQYNGPDGLIGFNPKITPEDFKAAYTAAEGWGSFEQKKNGKRWTATLRVLHGKMKLNEIRLPWIHKGVVVKHGEKIVPCAVDGGELRLKDSLVLSADGNELVVVLE